jgi:hypothetical protein
VDNLEVKPLGMTLGINVIFKPQVVFNVIYFNGSSQIAIFESAIENKHIFLLWDVDSVRMSWLSSHK